MYTVVRVTYCHRIKNRFGRFSFVKKIYTFKNQSDRKEIRVEDRYKERERQKQKQFKSNVSSCKCAQQSRVPVPVQVPGTSLAVPHGDRHFSTRVIISCFSHAQ